MTPVKDDAPLKIAYDKWKASEEYANTKKWAAHEQHLEGSLWGAFMAGFLAATPTTPKQEEM
jgi:hypothetical protein